ncbi:hypothetical protein ACLK2E_14830 [Escherichia coli]
MDALRPGDRWEMPYLPIDPQDIGRVAEGGRPAKSASGANGTARGRVKSHGARRWRARWRGI